MKVNILGFLCPIKKLDNSDHEMKPTKVKKKCLMGFEPKTYLDVPSCTAA